MGISAHRRLRMEHTREGNFFSLPNETFLLGLRPGELAMYNYLRQRKKVRRTSTDPAIKPLARQLE